jgi:hypothetical protein
VNTTLGGLHTLVTRLSVSCIKAHNNTGNRFFTNKRSNRNQQNRLQDLFWLSEIFPQSNSPARHRLPGLLRHKNLVTGNKLSKTREKIERKRDQPGYTSPNPEDKQLTLSLQPVGYRKPGQFGSAYAHRIQTFADYPSVCVQSLRPCAPQI